jgi:hypothetical protein
MRDSARGGIGLGVLLAIVIVLGSGFPVASAAPARAQGIASAGHVSGGIDGKVTWNGVDIGQASNSSSAFQVSYTMPSIDVRYFWNSTIAGASYNISTIRLQMFFFGFSVITRDVPPINQSTGDLTWDAVSELRWLAEGTYALLASLIGTDGRAYWNEVFYVHVSAPYSLLAAAPIVLVALLLYELYSVATSGAKDAAKARRPGAGAAPAASSGPQPTGPASPPADETPKGGP